MTTYKYRLFTNKKQESLLNQIIEESRQLYNYCLSSKIASWQCDRINITYCELCRWNITGRKFVSNISLLQQTLRRLDQTYRKFFRGGGFPRFKGKYRFNTIKFSKIGDGFSIKNHRLYVQNIGNIKVKWHRKLNGDIKTCYITRKNDKFYVSFVLINDIKPTLSPQLDKVGIDLGIRNFIALSDKTVIKNPKFLSEYEEKISNLQSRIDKNPNKSKQKDKLIKTKRNLFEKLTNSRMDFQNKLVHELCSKYKGFVVEDIKIATMNLRIKKYIYDVSWNSFLTKLKHKAENAGLSFEKVSPNYTSQICSQCGIKVKKTLKQRTHKCKCGYVEDRDVNASINILARAVPLSTA